MNEIIQIRNLRKKFGKNELLKGVDLSVKQGDMLAITGDNGTGKTTLLRIINQLERFDYGSVSVFGSKFTSKSNINQNINRNLDLRRKMLMVFQKPVLLNATVYENLNFGLRIRRIRDKKDKISDVLDVLGLKDKMFAHASTLSGGETQRVALAQFMILKPKLLLLDEPTANLDAKNERLVERLIKEANEAGTTILVTVHNSHRLKKLCKRTFILKDGKLI